MHFKMRVSNEHWHQSDLKITNYLLEYMKIAQGALFIIAISGSLKAYINKIIANNSF